VLLQLDDPGAPREVPLPMSAARRVAGTARVPRELAGRRLDQAAAELFEDYSRAVLRGWIEAGALTVDGEHAKPKRRLTGGEVLTLDAELEAREDWGSAQDVGFELVFEDEYLLVINKPAGVVVHPGAGNPDRTLVNGLLRHRASLALLPRAGIVHRLDKDTSGLMLVAATLPARKRLVDQLAARQVSRRYLAIAEGLLAGARDVDLPIGRHPRQRTRQAVRADGREALTRLEVVERFRAHTLIEATLATGRTHQIRVHLAAIGHPLLGDRRYGARGRLPAGATAVLAEAVREFPRQALHAFALGFEHPISGERLHFEAAMPEDMEAVRKVLAADRDAADDGDVLDE
jgi:23S rRNA pseudouridine1911/1915/1917 synthase